jgi:hypothetical protein
MTDPGGEIDENIAYCVARTLRDAKVDASTAMSAALKAANKANPIGYFFAMARTGGLRPTDPPPPPPPPTYLSPIQPPDATPFAKAPPRGPSALAKRAKHPTTPPTTNLAAGGES